MAKFDVTYEIVTPESAENGEVAEQDFIVEDVTLREALGLIGGYALEADSYPIKHCPPRWLTNNEYNEDFRTGGRESRSLHIPANATKSTRLRIARLAGLKIA